MVDERTSEYAGLYEWDGEAAARRYGRYITAVLRPLSARSSTGFDLLGPGPLDARLDPCASGHAAGSDHRWLLVPATSPARPPADAHQASTCEGQGRSGTTTSPTTPRPVEHPTS